MIGSVVTYPVETERGEEKSAIMRVAVFLIAFPLAVSAEELIGIWEREVGPTPVGFATMQVVFSADSTFETNQFIQVDNDNYFFRTERKNNPLLPLIEVLSLHATGAYAIDNDRMAVVLHESYLLIDGDTFVDYFTEVGRKLARFLANSNEIPDETYDEYERSIVKQYLEEVDQEDYYNVFRSAQNEDVFPMRDMQFHIPYGDRVAASGNEYFFEGETLMIGGEKYVRVEEVVDIPTSVQVRSWGAIKRILQIRRR